MAFRGVCWSLRSAGSLLCFGLIAGTALTLAISPMDQHLWQQWLDRRLQVVTASADSETEPGYPVAAVARVVLRGPDSRADVFLLGGRGVGAVFPGVWRQLATGELALSWQAAAVLGVTCGDTVSLMNDSGVVRYGVVAIAPPVSLPGIGGIWALSSESPSHPQSCCCFTTTPARPGEALQGPLQGVFPLSGLFPNAPIAAMCLSFACIALLGCLGIVWLLLLPERRMWQAVTALGVDNVVAAGILAATTGAVVTLGLALAAGVGWLEQVWIIGRPASQLHLRFGLTILLGLWSLLELSVLACVVSLNFRRP